MNILVIMEKDAANTSLMYVVNAFIRRGHFVNIYVPFDMFDFLDCKKDDIRKIPLDRLKKEDVQTSDMIVCSTLSSVYLPNFIFCAHKPIFTHNYLLNRQINWGGDVCFAPSVATVASDYDECLNYSYIGVGEPKYDNQARIATNNKRFLFIDSGHYPFSMEGKKELAKTLIDICYNYPDYELWIKPRFLPNDKIITHRNDIHLYDVIKNESNDNIPINMVMLDYHVDLKELINQSQTVICMYTTAFVGALAAGKGLIILENLPTTDVYDIRHKTYMRNRENMIASGALVDYREVQRLLPNGVRGNREYLNFLLEEKENVAEKICEVCEYLTENFYSKNKFPRKCNSTYREYKEDFIEDDEMTWNKLLTKRYYDYILFKSLILIDFHVKAQLDISYVLERANKCYDENGLIQESVFHEFLQNVNDIRDNCIICNRELMLEDKIDAGVLLNAYYLQHMYQDIKEFPIQDIAAYDMYRAFAAMETNEEDYCLTAKKHLILYFDKCLQRKYNLEISDMSNNKFKSFEMLIQILLDEENYELVRYYAEELKKFYKKIYLDEFEVVPMDPLQKQRYDFIVEVNNIIDGETIK